MRISCSEDRPRFRGRSVAFSPGEGAGGGVMTIASILLALVVGTWNGEWFPSGRAEHRASDEVERETIRAAGQMLREGLQFHPSSKNWPDTFRRAATALKNPGDVSKPFAADDGIHILQYVEDIPGGVHKLTEEEQSALYSAALQQKQLSVLGEQIEKWRSRYTIKTNPELLENL